MACLNYSSSKIEFDDVKYSREDLLAKKLVLVSKSRREAITTNKLQIHVSTPIRDARKQSFGTFRASVETKSDEIEEDRGAENLVISGMSEIKGVKDQRPKTARTGGY